MKSKRFFSVLLLVAVLALSACGGAPPEAPSAESEAVRQEQNSSAPLLGGSGSADKERVKADGGMTLYYLDVGQADSVIVECDGHYMLIDGGNVADSSLLYSFLKSHEITQLDYVIGSHEHEDHIGGIAGALQYAKAGKVYCSAEAAQTEAFENFKNAVSKQGLSILKPAAGETFSLGSAKVEILAPINDSYSDPNNLSIVQRITYGETSFLFTGDCAREEEQDLLAAGYALESTVLKVGHHGSEESTTYPFLREVLPKYAIISVGKGNSYGHPAAEALSRLRDAGAAVYRTDERGTITCHTDGRTVRFEFEKNVPAPSDADDLPPSAEAEMPPTQAAPPSAAVAEPPVQEPQAPASAEKPPTHENQDKEANYLGNMNSKKLHKITCGTGQRTAEKNRIYFEARDEAIAQGYEPGKCCNP